MDYISFMADENRYCMPGSAPSVEPDGGQQEREMLESLQRRITASVRRTCPYALACRAEDFVQTVLLRLLAVSKKNEGGKRFSSVYLEKTVYAVIVDELRRPATKKEALLLEQNMVDKVISYDPDPEREASSTEIGEGIQACLEGLAKPRRLAVTLYLQGCTVPRVALHLRWTLKKTENLVYRGLADLRSCLRSRGVTP